MDLTGYIPNAISEAEKEASNFGEVEVWKTALQKQLQTLTLANVAATIEEPLINPKEAGNSNFRFFHEHESEESHLVPFIYKYRLIDS